jgi:hypothetical protein
MPNPRRKKSGITPPFSNHRVVVVNAHLKTTGSNPEMAENPEKLK